MPQKQTAVVVVSKDWLNTAARILITEGRPSRSEAETHIFIAPLEDASDPRGLWLSDVTTHELTKDGSQVTMKVMVPWSFVLALGIIESEDPRVEMGFRHDPATS